MRTFNIYRDLKRTTSNHWLFAALAATMWLSATAYAVDGTRGMSQYMRQRWGSEQGLSGMVNAIAQTPDGYLWVGTDKALYRFDGQTFLPVKVADSTIAPIKHVLALTVDGKGVLWVWTQGTHVLRYESGTFKNAFPSLPFEGGVTAIGRAVDYEVLLSTLVHGIVGSSGSDFVELAKSTGPLVISIAQTTDKRVWLGTRETGLLYVDGKRSYPMPGALPDKKINCLLPGDHGQLWIGTDAGLALWNGTELITRPMPAPLDRAQILSLVKDHEGNLWVGTEHGLLRYNDKGAYLLKDTYGKETPVTALFEDLEGNIWLGDSRGIERLRDSPFNTFSSIENLPGNTYGPLFVDGRERTWFAPKQGGLYWLRDGQLHRVKSAGLDSDIVYSIDGAKDDVWLGRQRGGLTHLHLGGENITEETYKPGKGDDQHVPYTVHENRDGSVWAGTLTGGAIHILNGRITTYNTEDGLASNSVSAIEEGMDGGMWFGTPNGLSFFYKNLWHNYSVHDGIPSLDIICLLQDKRGVLWIGTAAGLAYLVEGVVHAVSPEVVPLSDRILGIAEDQKGWLWIATANHIFKVDSESIRGPTIDPIDIREYGIADGLRGLEGVRRSRSVVKDALGRVWISTTNGLSVVDPMSSANHFAPALVHIEGVLVDGKPADQSGELKVSGAQKRITFNYTGLSFAAPERVRFRYRLDGFDRSWSEPVTERQAIYTNLPPGSYRFRVIASDSEGRWSGAEGFFPLTVDPQLWQRWQFQTGCALLLAFFGVLLYRIRMRQMIRRATFRFEERLAERTRIAQELHDTLLQGFFSASMQLHVVTDMVRPDSPAKPHLNRILKLMGKVLDEGRDAVRGLRSVDENKDSLEQIFNTIARDTGSESHAKYSIVVEGLPRTLRPVIHEEVCRVGREALGNAFRHARADLIEVEIAYSLRRFKIEVRDDGCGMDSSILEFGRDGHWGLPGMRERADRIGAKLRITSRVEQGTEIKLTVPGHIAFQEYSNNPVLNWLIGQSRSRVSAKTKEKVTEKDTSSQDLTDIFP